MAKVVYVDVDDTLVRSLGSKRSPMRSVIEQVKRLHADGAEIIYGAPAAPSMRRKPRRNWESVRAASGFSLSRIYTLTIRRFMNGAGANIFFRETPVTPNNAFESGPPSAVAHGRR
jgi:hypothetical protein